MGGVSTGAVTSMVIFYHQSPWMMPSTWSDGDTNRDDQDDCHELSSTHISFLCNQIFVDFEPSEPRRDLSTQSPPFWELGGPQEAFWAELEQDDEKEHTRGRKYAIHALNELTFHFRSRRTKPPTYTYTVMRSVLRSGNSHFAGQYVQSLALHRNSSSLMHCLSRPLFSSSVLFGAELMHSASTHTPCSIIIHFRLDAYFDHFTLYAPKQDRKIGVANLMIFCYLLSITAFCAPTALLLASIFQYVRYALKNFRLFSYFPNPVALLKSGRAARFSRSILAL